MDKRRGLAWSTCMTLKCIYKYIYMYVYFLNQGDIDIFLNNGSLVMIILYVYVYVYVYICELKKMIWYGLLVGLLVM